MNSPTHPARSVPRQHRFGRPRHAPLAALIAGCLSLLGGTRAAAPALPAWAPLPPGLTYTNHRLAEVPWSVHVVRWPRTNAHYQLHSAHATGGAVGLTTLSDQISRLDPRLGTPVAALNGDFYQRDRAFAGDPRGLQVVDGEIISAPTGGACFWLDAGGRPYATNLASLFRVTWPDGTTTPFGLNEERKADALVLYTPAVGVSTHTTGGRELVLEPEAGGAWLPLRMSATYRARVREVRNTGDTPLTPATLVLSLGPGLVPRLPAADCGAVVQLTTAATADLSGTRTAIGGGPILVRKGRAQKIEAGGAESYQFSSMLERHPRSAIGWNQEEFFLVLVDGRQKNLSVGMTLKELGTSMIGLGCEEAMNLDGGGSAVLWCGGAIRNSPCDGRERVIANSLILTRKEAALDSPAPTSGP